MQNFTSFLENAETKSEICSQPVLFPGSTCRIGQPIADSIPAPLGETIFYRYSFFTGFAPSPLQHVDIRPGMRLRVETQASQLVSAGP